MDPIRIIQLKNKSQTQLYQKFRFNRLKKIIKINFKCFNYLFNIIGKINYPVDIII